jgi:hypothetical protein
MAKMSKFRLDIETVERGRWVDWRDGVRLLIASVDSPAYVRASREYFRENREACAEAFGEDQNTRALFDALRPVFAKTILLGWEGIDDEDGNPIPYSPENALTFLTDPELVHLWDFVLSAAQNVAAYRRSVLEAVRKN